MVKSSIKLNHNYQFLNKKMKALNITKLSKKYEDNTVLQDISLSINCGAFVGVIGRNGSGKTTFMKCVANITECTTGKIELFEKPLTKEYLKYLGYMPQDYNFNEFDTANIILTRQLALFGMDYDQKKIENILDKVSLLQSLNNPIGTLSGGMKRRLMLARALITDPKLVILDEPSAGVDIQNKRNIWKHLHYLNKEQNVTFLLSTHSVEEMDMLCSEIIITKRQTIIGPRDIGEIKAEIHNTSTYRIKLSKSKDNYNLSECIYKCTWGDEFNLKIECPISVGFGSIVDLLRNSGIDIDKDVQDIFKQPYSLSKIFD